MTRNSSTSSARLNAVADYFLLNILVDCGDSITNLKMQRMVYYAQAWCLALHGKPMFDDRIEAWSSGPVCPTLWQRLRKQSGPYNWDSIDPTRRKTQPLNVLNEKEKELLDEVWDHYSRFSSSELSALACRELPWKTTYNSEFPGGRCNEEITPESMKKFYGELEKDRKVLFDSSQTIQAHF